MRLCVGYRVLNLRGRDFGLLHCLYLPRERNFYANKCFICTPACYRKWVHNRSKYMRGARDNSSCNASFIKILRCKQLTQRLQNSESQKNMIKKCCSIFEIASNGQNSLQYSVMNRTIFFALFCDCDLRNLTAF